MANVQKRGDSYRIRVSCGYSIDGKQITRSTTWTPSSTMSAKQIEKELQRQVVLFEEQCRTGQVLDSAVRFGDFAETWMRDYAEKQLRPKTLDSYRLFLKRILPALGHIRLDRIQPQHLLAFYGNLQETGVRDDTKYLSKVDFKVLLKQQGLTKVKLTELAGVSLTVLDSVIQHKNISPASAEKISKALDMPIAELFDTVEKAGGELAAETIRHYHALISSIMSTAVHWQMIPYNPCDRIKPPKLDRKPPRYLDEVQAAHLMDLLEGEAPQYQTTVKLLLYTGFRRGELCGLQWEDIDFTNALIWVRRSSQYVAGKGTIEDETKNKTSERCIKVPQVAIDLLQEHKRWQTEQRLMLGDRWHDSGRIITAEDGSPINPTVLTGWFHRFVQKNDLPDISLHSLRHTNATLQIAGGVPLPTIAKRLGHADTTTTSRVYIHAIRSADEAAAETLQDIFAPTANRNKIG